MPKEIGSWSGIINIPVFAVHGAVIYNSLAQKWKVMLFSGGEEANNPPTGGGDLRKSFLWDPDTNSFSSQQFTLIGATDDSDPFCAHQCQLPDGRLLVMGGAFYGGPDGQGIKATWVFDPTTETWSRASDMAYGRWYPTAVMMADGNILVASGRTTGAPVPQMEVFDPDTETWSTLPASADKSLAIYPSLHLVPAGPNAGKIFYSGTRWSSGGGPWAPPVSAFFDPASNTWQDVDDHNVGNRTEGFAVLLPPAECARILVLGGGATAGDGDPDSAEIIDLRAASPQWDDVQDMHHERTNVTAVVLPNGTVFVFGGHSDFKWNASGGAAGDLHTYICEIFDPETGGWMETPPMARPRQYHSVGVLLPDGRVLCAGGVFPGTGDQQNMEIYSPPYLNAPSRPVITAAPTSLNYGDPFQVSTPQSDDVARVVMVRPCAVTHHTDSEQRLLRLSFHKLNAGTIEATAPGNANLAPPGYYMLFLVDACGVPSVAKFVRIGPALIKGLKDIKDLKEKDFKEKEIKEFKEIKEKDLKDKDKDKEFKEFKEKEKEIKEKDKEIKEKDKDKDIFEGPGGFGGALEHFIRPELRPDLTGAALAREPNVRLPQSVDPASLDEPPEPARPEDSRGKTRGGGRRAKPRTRRK